MKKKLLQEVILPSGAQNIELTTVNNKIQILFDIVEDQNQKCGIEESKGTKKWLDKYFPIVPASTLSLDDEIFHHEPKMKKQREFKEKLIKVINYGLYDFRAQRMDPCLDENGNICFKSGMMPAVRKSMIWWAKQAKEFLPEKESRLGSEEERIAFLALLMKELIEEWGYSISDAWEAVCDQSSGIGHYWDSKDAKHDFEPTGSRQVGRWYDLGNTYKIVKNNTNGFFLAGGNYKRVSDFYPLISMQHDNSPNDTKYVSVGWTVLSV